MGDVPREESMVDMLSSASGAMVGVEIAGAPTWMVVSVSVTLTGVTDGSKGCCEAGVGLEDVALHSCVGRASGGPPPESTERVSSS